MGRGRNYGPVDQSTKKPKLTKNKVRGDLQLFHPHRIEENKELPILVSEELLAEMKKMSPQEFMGVSFFFRQPNFRQPNFWVGCKSTVVAKVWECLLYLLFGKNTVLGLDLLVFVCFFCCRKCTKV